jgi:flagellar biosynthesis chaperone FliJ
VRKAEQTRAVSGAASVDEALRARAWRDRRAREASDLRAAITRADDAARLASEAAEQARAALAHARVERESVEKHHARWAEAQRRAADARAEADADDLANKR